MEAACTAFKYVIHYRIFNTKSLIARSPLHVYLILLLRSDADTPNAPLHLYRDNIASRYKRRVSMDIEAMAVGQKGLIDKSCNVTPRCPYRKPAYPNRQVRCC